ncbi:MAG TPA: zinc ribbon domain-containing protein [Pirellulaceae bacterium]|nr:zinc ribbon domain-containing protein [Pirellulaceae bacterium]
MPLYEYCCQQCGTHFELLVRHGESARCPNCSAERVEKQLSVPAVPVSARNSLPLATPPSEWSGCGRPQCASGGCQGFDD